MANLETLELTIQSNAESASKGVRSFIGSLSVLSKEVGKNISGLKMLNAELDKIKGLSSINFSRFSNNSMKAVNSETKALTENAKATKTWAETHSIVAQSYGGQTGK